MTFRDIRVAGVALAMAAAVGTVAHLSAQTIGVRPAEQKVVPQIIEPDPIDDFTKGAVSFKTPGLVVPTLARSVNPKYTPATLQAKIEGDVTLEAIVGIDGRVEKSRVKASLDPDLDAEAIKTLKEWRFEPGTMQGAPVRVVVQVEMAFRVR